MDLPKRSNVAIPENNVAALEEVLVSLRVIKATDHRPHGRYWGRDFLDHSGAALVGPHWVAVVDGNRVWDLRCASQWRPAEDDGGGGGWCLLRLLTCCGYDGGAIGARGVVAIDSVK